MNKYNLIILVGGDKSDLCIKTGYSSKSLIPIHDKPMLDWMIEAYINSKYIKNIIVVGPQELEKCASMRFVKKRINSSNSIIQNVLFGAGYIKNNLVKSSEENIGYLLSFCDAPLINPKIIDETIKKIDECSAEIILHLLKKKVLRKKNS